MLIGDIQSYSRVKELKGDTNISLEENAGVDYEPDYDTSDVEADVPNDYDETSLLIDQEAPPDNMNFEEDIKSPAVSAPVIAKLAKPQGRNPPRSSITSFVPGDNIEIRASLNSMVSAADTVVEKTGDVDLMMDELIKLHRQHLRDSTESGKSESKLLVNFTMKRSTTDRVNVTNEKYINELDDYLRSKMESISLIRAKIALIKKY